MIYHILMITRENLYNHLNWVYSLNPVWLSHSESTAVGPGYLAEGTNKKEGASGIQMICPKQGYRFWEKYLEVATNALKKEIISVLTWNIFVSIFLIKL